jgi:thioredoxin-related protein
MNKWRKRIEVASNIAVIICCILFAVLLIKNFLSNGGQQAPVSLIGRKLILGNVDWTQSDHTLVFVLREGCHFCDESAPFYRRLTNEFSNQSKLHLVAILPHSSDESRQYLKEKMIEIADVKQASLSSIGVRGTPTLLLVDNTGTVLEQWTGKLPSDQEDAVLARLKQ